MADEEKRDEENEGVAKGGTSKLVLILLIVNMLGLAGIAVYVLFLMPEPKVPMTPEEMAAQAGSKLPGLPTRNGEAGPMLDVGTLVINLREPGGEHFLKTRISLELDSEESRAEVEARLSQIRYQINMLLAGQRLADVQGPDNMEALRQAMVRRIEAVVGRGRVVAVWPEEWIVQ